MHTFGINRHIVASICNNLLCHARSLVTQKFIERREDSIVFFAERWRMVGYVVLVFDTHLLCKFKFLLSIDALTEVVVLPESNRITHAICN